MRIRTDLLPQGSYAGEVVLLVDVLRSCTAAPILFDNGLARLSVTPSLRLARALAASEGSLLLGERGGMVPEGFNHGNSPAELRRLDLEGRTALMVSENLPKALPHLDGAREVLLASLYNAGAAARLAAHLASSTSVAIVCCGFGGQEDLDDAVAAGLLAAELRRVCGAAEPVGATRFAVGLLRAFPDPLAAFWQSVAGRYLRRLEHAEDLAVASLVSHSERVPRLVASEQAERGPVYRFEGAGVTNLA